MITRVGGNQNAIGDIALGERGIAGGAREDRIKGTLVGSREVDQTRKQNSCLGGPMAFVGG